MREVQRLDELGFGNFVSRTFDHDDVVFGTDVNEIQITLLALGMSGIGNELAVYSADANRADRTGKRNIGDAQRSGSAVDGQNVRIILAIGTEQNADDLGVVKISLRKERPKRPIGHSRGQRFLFATDGLRA